VRAIAPRVERENVSGAGSATSLASFLKTLPDVLKTVPDTLTPTDTLTPKDHSQGKMRRETVGAPKRVPDTVPSHLRTGGAADLEKQVCATRSR
jgi:hypothetical protein